ncbi:formyl-CoA transferase [Subtercola boreus]|uniref:Formyl-CoA transferase n=1 Tax=Subtercola boreus TaxID=120213 RepID=A0A3E0VZ28_9MICO|nr:CoA transferase [Subtercola boreus]RFA14598.1 formyl-CoA transferase [Subtercola boreus]
MTDATDGRMALDDLRVIELGQLLAGPFCGQLLGDFGADVIKVEAPGKGDPIRQWGQAKADGHSLWWPVLGRNKRTITLNLREKDGQDVLRLLVAEADVLLENFRPGTLERWGLSPDELWEINPRLIITRVSGYGQTGPYAARAGFGSVGEAMGGIRYVTGSPETAPSRAGISLGDELAAVFACIGTLAALHDRGRTGRGQVVDSAIYEAVFAMMESLIPEWQIAGYTRERTGATLPGVAPSNVYPTRRGEMVLIAANQDSVFGRLCTAMGRPELATDERFATHNARGENMKELDDLVAGWTATHELDDVLTRMHEAGIPAGLIYTAKDMLSDPHFAARDAIVTLADKHFGEISMQSTFPRLSASPGRVRHTGREMGEDNEDVYGHLLGLGTEAIARLRADGII